jgi:hypothetical protein
MNMNELKYKAVAGIMHSRKSSGNQWKRRSPGKALRHYGSKPRHLGTQAINLRLLGTYR